MYLLKKYVVVYWHYFTQTISKNLGNFLEKIVRCFNFKDIKSPNAKNALSSTNFEILTFFSYKPAGKFQDLWRIKYFQLDNYNDYRIWSDISFKVEMKGLEGFFFNSYGTKVNFFFIWMVEQLGFPAILRFSRFILASLLVGNSCGKIGAWKTKKK